MRRNSNKEGGGGEVGNREREKKTRKETLEIFLKNEAKLDSAMREGKGKKESARKKKGGRKGSSPFREVYEGKGLVYEPRKGKRGKKAR